MEKDIELIEQEDNEIEKEIEDFYNDDVDKYLNNKEINSYLDNSTKLYLKEISKYPLLSKEEQKNFYQSTIKLIIKKFLINYYSVI